MKKIYYKYHCQQFCGNKPLSNGFVCQSVCPSVTLWGTKLFSENLGARYMSIFKLWRGSKFFSKVWRGYENDFSRFPVKLKRLSGTPSCCSFATEFTKINPKIQKSLSPLASIKNGRPLYIYITLNFYFYLNFSVNFKNDSFRLTISPNLLDPNELMNPRNE